MRLQAKISAILGIFATVVTLSTCSLDAKFKSGLEYFSHNIFHELVNSNGHKNIIFSPFSAQTCLAMVRMGADGETAAEMERAMGFSGRSAKFIANNYYALLSHYENSSQLHLANKVYVMENYELDDNYNEMLAEKFISAAESINFRQNVKAAEVINKWVESQTNHLIKEVITPEMLSSDTRMVLINAIHFKGEWLKPFDAGKTKQQDFYINENNTVKVDMMKIEDKFEYGQYRGIDAEAVRLPYKDSDLSMWIFLPFKKTGLLDMVAKLKERSLKSLTKRMINSTVLVWLPKFKAEFTIELTDTLKQLNMQHLFTNTNFGKMLASPESLSVSHVVQKAFIEVTEMGTEAAAVTGLVAESRMMPKTLIADHPFHYMIVNTENVVLFQGNVVDF